MAAEVGQKLGLIVGAARSGTTLLRLILDAHPEIGCPAEAGLPSLMAHMAGVWMTVDADVRKGATPGDPGGRPAGATPVGMPGEAREDPTAGAADRNAFAELPLAAREWIRTTMLGATARYCDRTAKSLYIDKSLDSVHHLALVQELFPNSRFVLVFRHVMDTVASGIQASPWGFNAYGYAPYVQASPNNSVAALANYWLVHVGEALKWEEAHSDVCHRVRYADLVLQPNEVVGGILQFLNVNKDLSVLERAFGRDVLRGPGDYKVEHTTSVHAGSIGHGKRVPVSMLPPPLLEAVNEKLEVLGYEPLGRAWNAQERSVDGGGVGRWSQRLSDLVAGVRLPGGDEAMGSFALVAEDHRALRWVIEADSGTVTQGDGQVDGVVTGTAEDLVLMLTREENLGVLLRSGRVRYITASEDEVPRDLASELNMLVRLIYNSASDLPGEGIVA